MDYYKVGKHSYFVDCKDRAEYNEDVTEAINSSNHIVRYVPKYSFVYHSTSSDKNSYCV